MSGREYRGGAHHAPAPHDRVRAPLTRADDYTPAPAAGLGEAWDYEAHVDATDVRWIAAAGQRQGGAQRARVLRGRAA